MKMSNEKNSEKKLSKKDINKVFWRWILNGESGWTYEKMQGLCYAYTMMPALRKIYTDEDELNIAVKNHLQFFNTNPTTAHFILGANLAIEEEMGIKSREAVTSIKTGMMGPLAGVGDTLFVVIYGTVFGSIAAYMALSGNWFGVAIWLVAGLFRVALCRGFIQMGYDEGVKLVTNVGDKLNNVTEGANILGLTVIGALIPTVINAKILYVFKQGAASMPVQSLLDKVMPSLIPVCIVAFVYWLLGKKKMNSTRALLILIVFSIGVHALGLL